MRDIILATLAITNQQKAKRALIWGEFATSHN